MPLPRPALPFALALLCESACPSLLAADITITLHERYSEDCVSPPASVMDSSVFLARSANEVLASKGRCLPSVRFTGEIDGASISALQNVLKAFRDRVGTESLSLWLESAGGDINAAMSFGTFIRDQNFQYVLFSVQPRTRCDSACVFMLAAGYQRSVYGTVGIHRPYFSPARVMEMGYNDLKQAYDDILPKVKAYLRSVNIRDTLADDMWQIPSDKVTDLSTSDLARYGLSRADIVFTEKRNAAIRDACGDAALAAKDDFWRIADARCTLPSGSLSMELMQRYLSDHPYCSCFRRANPASSLRCSGETPPAALSESGPRTKLDARPDITYNGDIYKAAVLLRTTQGPIRIRLFPDIAPRHVGRFLDLVSAGFYNGTAFHRVIPGFMVQAGDPLTKNPEDESAWGKGKLTDSAGRILALSPEFSTVGHRRGIVSMSRLPSNPESATCQFFIVVKDSPDLDGKYTVFGEVIEGMDVVDRIVAASDSDSESGGRGRPRRYQWIREGAVLLLQP